MSTQSDAQHGLGFFFLVLVLLNDHIGIIYLVGFLEGIQY